MTNEQQRTLKVAIHGYAPWNVNILRPDGKTILPLEGIVGLFLWGMSEKFEQLEQFINLKMDSEGYIGAWEAG